MLSCPDWAQTRDALASAYWSAELQVHTTMPSSSAVLLSMQAMSAFECYASIQMDFMAELAVRLNDAQRAGQAGVQNGPQDSGGVLRTL